jgi:hypothetical protein
MKSESDPPVQSKFDRSHGKGLKVRPVEKPGDVAPMPRESGHELGIGEHRPALGKKAK